MQAITYTMVFPKIRGAVLVAIISGILAATSILVSFHMAKILQVEEDRWFWLYVALTLSVLVLLVEPFALALLSSRVPIFRPIGFLSVQTAAMCLLAGIVIWGLQDLGATGGLDWMTVPGLWPSRLDPSVISGISVAIGVAAVGILLTVAALWDMRKSAAKQSFILDDKGLTCQVWGGRWYWGWHELSTPELCAPSGLSGVILGRHIALNRIERGGRTILTDVWSGPLDAIHAKLKDHREQALAARSASGIRDRLGEEWAGADLAEVSYPQSRKSLVRRAVGLGVLLLLLLSVLGGRYLLAFDSFAAYWAAEAGLILAAGGSILLLLAAIAAPLHPRFAARMVLRFDGKGLTLGGLFRRRRRFWYDLSEFELDPGQLSRPALYFFFRGPGPHGAVESGRIGDSYDTPLDEIAAKLNDYRKQALDGE